jgi:hypothetical protein
MLLRARVDCAPGAGQLRRHRPLQVESRRGNKTRNILVDFGFTPEALLNNTESAWY